MTNPWPLDEEPFKEDVSLSELADVSADDTFEAYDAPERCFYLALSLHLSVRMALSDMVTSILIPWTAFVPCVRLLES